MTVETNGSKTFRRNGVGVTSPLLSDGTKAYTPGVSSRESGVSTFQHSGLKNATDQTSAAQSVTASRHYDAFGNLISSSGTWQGTHGYGGGVGYQEDANGLKLLGHRYYDSDTGRFLSQDPVGDGCNWYTYCENNPVTSSDPSGLLFQDPAGNRTLAILEEYMKNHGFNEVYTARVMTELKLEFMLASRQERFPDRMKALVWAIDNLDNMTYDSSDGRNKCNIFVYDAYEIGAGATMPDKKLWLPGEDLYRANDFANPAIEIGYFNGGGTAKSGDIVAFGTALFQGTGHVTMKVAAGLLIYANDIAGVKIATFNHVRSEFNSYYVRKRR